MPTHLGMRRPGSTVRFPFSTSDSAGGYAAMTNDVAADDIKIYKNGTATAKTGDTGLAIDNDVESIIGCHWLSIDLSASTTGEETFYQAGASYTVYLSPVTVDGQQVQTAIGSFDIGYPEAVINTTMATRASQTSFTLTAGPAEDDALNGSIVIIHAAASAVQLSYGIISDYTGSSKTVTLAAAPTYTTVAGDNVSVLAPTGLIAVNGAVITGTGGTVDANVVSVSGDTTAADTLELFAEALDQTTGQIDSGTFAAGAVTAASIAADAIVAAKINADVWAELLAVTVDGIAVSSIIEAALAFVGGKREVTDNGATREIIFMKRDGTTPKLTFAAASETDGSTSAGATIG